MTMNVLSRFYPWLLLFAASRFHFLAAKAEVATWYDCPNTTAPLYPAVIKGKRFFNSGTGEYIPIKGIGYYPRPNAGPLSVSNSVDFLTEDFRDLWEADIANFKKLGVNTVRIYAVDPSASHDAFMCAMLEARIYVVIGILADCEGCSIGPHAAPSCYPDALKERGQFVINTFSKYNNTLAFSAGNEVAIYATNRTTALNAPCQKKFIRDMRAYAQNCSEVLNSILPRRVPIGVVTADFDRAAKALYYSCRTDPTDELENAEWYGLNAYLQCNPEATSINDLAGYIQLRKDFANYSLPEPFFLAEFGCTARNFPTIDGFEAQRTWLQIDAIYDPSYADVLAGGIVFEYSAEKRYADLSPQGNPFPYHDYMKLNYGIGYYTPGDCDDKNISCQYVPYPEFELLARKMKAVNSSFVPNMNDFNAPSHPNFPQCPSGLPSISDFSWPSDGKEDLPCYVALTPAPTQEPSSSPTLSPTTFPLKATGGASLVSMKEPSSSPTLSSTTFPLKATGGASLVSMQEPSSSPTLAPTTFPLKVTGGASLVSTQEPSSSPTLAPTIFSLVSTQEQPSGPALSPSTFPQQAMGGSSLVSSSSGSVTCQYYNFITVIMLSGLLTTYQL